MKEKRMDPYMPDRILAQMAQETPEMPADFHDRWTRAVREEAAGRKRAEKHSESRRQWRYLLGAAAVFVFLIGGTLLTRSPGKNNRTESTLKKTETAVEERAAEESAEADLFMAEESAEDMAPEAGPEIRSAEKNAAWAANVYTGAGAAVPNEAPVKAAGSIREETAGENGFVSFLKDLGIFTLKTLGAAAAAAVLAFGAAVVHRAWKKRKNEKG